MTHDFVLELQELLKKHNASIGFSCGEHSDTHGLYDEKLLIDIGNTTVFEVEGWWLDGDSLNERTV